MEPRRRFRIIKELSEGAFGKVYLAEMITGDNFKSVVAIKLLHGKWAGHEEIVQRSRDEARVLGLLHHRNIIRVEDLTSINGQCAVVMEYLNGVDMKTLCTYVRDRGKTLPRKIVLEVGSQIASALHAAYNHRPLQGGDPLELIHRDIKPSNVMLTCAGEVKVLDFGTAQARFDHREAETQALAFGSAAYMAPERLLGDQDQHWGDVFSLGITVYEMLALKSFGKIQVRPERNAEHLATCLSELDLSDMDPVCATELKAFLSRMLSYEAEDRPSAIEVVEFMEELADRVHDGTVRRFCREVVTPCREMVEPEQDPNDPLAGSTLFEDTTTISEHDTVVGGNWMDETEEEDSQASSLRSLGVDRGHIEVSADELQSRPTVVATKDVDSEGKGSSIHPLAVPEPRNAEGQETLAGSQPLSDLPTENHSSTDIEGPTADLTDDELDSGTAEPPVVDPDSTGPFPAKNESQLSDPERVSEAGHTPLPVLVEGSTTTMSGAHHSAGHQDSTRRVLDPGSQVGESSTEDSDTGHASASDSHGSGAVTEDARAPDPTGPGSDGEDSELSEPRKSGRGKLVAIFLLLVAVFGGVGIGVWKSGLLDKKSSSSKSDEDDDQAKSEDAEGGASDPSGTVAPQEVIRMQDGESYSLKQTEEGKGTSLQLTIDGEVKYVLFGKLEHHSWDGQGTVTIRNIEDSMLRVTVAVEGDSRQRQHPLKLGDRGIERVCWVYSVEGDELRGVSCD
jgi:serine/threonine protein kinase